MNRRDFLKLAGLTGLAVVTPHGANEAQANELYEGPLFLVVHASGGWDPTSLCDPKGRASAAEVDPMNRYLIQDIRTPSESSPLRWAPFGANEAFFSRHFRKLLIINGLDTSTNNHDVGPRHIHSGTLSEGHPAFAAMVAAHYAKESPLGFLTYGGYDVTRGVVSRARAGNNTAIERVAQPNRIDATTNFHTPGTMDRIREAHLMRTEQILHEQHLPHLQGAVSSLMTARMSEDPLKHLSGLLPNLNNFSTGLGRQAALAIAAWRVGLCVSANLSTGGFDTHANHDTTQATAMSSLTNGLNEIMAYAETLGVAENIYLIVGSDFGRTPGYNAGNGKDHWPITSMMLMGPGIEGNRVLGLTDPRHRALRVNPVTLQEDPAGIVLKPVHVQRALRKLVGLDQSPMAASYPLPGEDLSLFG